MQSQANGRTNCFGFQEHVEIVVVVVVVLPRGGVDPLFWFECKM
jgi:hypothetical protein